MKRIELALILLAGVALYLIFKKNPATVATQPSPALAALAQANAQPAAPAPTGLAALVGAISSII